MSHARAVRIVLTALSLLVALTGAGLVLAAPLGTAFTYQGQLRQAGLPVNGTCDFQFSLFDAATGGAQVGTTQTAIGVTLADGRFTVQLVEDAVGWARRMLPSLAVEAAGTLTGPRGVRVDRAQHLGR